MPVKVQRWIKCRVLGGMFPGERSVEVDSNGMTVSFFIQADHRCLGDNMIRVTVLASNGGCSLVYLPQSSIEGGRTAQISDSLFIKKEQTCR